MRQLFAVLLIMSIASFAHAEKLVYRVGVENLSYYPLMDFNDEDKNSILKQIMNDFADAEGITFEFIPLPIQRFYTWYDEGAIDFRLPDNPSWTSENDPSLEYSDPIITLCADVVTLAENRDMPKEQFNRLGTLYGFLPDSKWELAVRTGKVDVVTDSSLKVLTRMLLNGMVDGLDLHSSTIRHQTELLGEPVTKIAVASDFAPSTITYRLSTREHKDILEKLNRYLETQKDKTRQITDAFSFRQGCAD